MKEIWKDIVDFENYQISNFGRVKSFMISKRYKSSERILKNLYDKNGYVLVNLYTNKKNHTFRLHQLIGKHFINNPHNYTQLNHLNGIKTDNSVENLEWVTAQENITHSIETGLRYKHRGSLHSSSILNEDKVREIRSLRGKYSQRIIGEMFGVERSTISNIFRNKTWNHVI